MAKKAETKAHGLDRGEKVIGQNGQIVVTSEGRKVRLDADNKVIERLVGPAYSWEKAEESVEDVQPEE